MERYGYIRVSAKDQNSERQLIAMMGQQIKQENIFLDKMSGKSFTRPQYLKILLPGIRLGNRNCQSKCLAIFGVYF